MIGCCKWLDRPTARLFCFVPKGEKTITKLGYFCRWINKKKKKNQKKTKKKKQVKEQIYLFLNKFRGYFFFYLLSWCSSPGSRSRKFLQLTPHNGRYPTSRGLNIFSFYLFFFIFDFYLNTFFFSHRDVHFLEMLTMSRESHPSRNPFICILESDKKPTKKK